MHDILTKRWQWLILMLVVPVSPGVTGAACYLLWTVNPRAFDNGSLVSVALGLPVVFDLASIMGVVSLLVRRFPKRTVVVLWILGTVLSMAFSGPSTNASTQGGRDISPGYVVGIMLVIYSFFLYLEWLMPGSTLRNMARGDRRRFFVDRRTKATVITTGVILLIVSITGVILLVAVVLAAVLAAGGDPDPAVVFAPAVAMFFEMLFLYLFWMCWYTWMKRGKNPAYYRPTRKSTIRPRQNVPARRSSTKRQVRIQHKSNTRSCRSKHAIKTT